MPCTISPLTHTDDGHEQDTVVVQGGEEEPETDLKHAMLGEHIVGRSD